MFIAYTEGVGWEPYTTAYEYNTCRDLVVKLRYLGLYKDKTFLIYHLTDPNSKPYLYGTVIPTDPE